VGGAYARLRGERRRLGDHRRRPARQRGVRRHDPRDGPRHRRYRDRPRRPDLFAALAIVLDKPFVVGDLIAVDTFSGTVEQIGLKTTRIRSLTGEQVIFANSELLKGRIRNFKRLYERRVAFTLDVAGDLPAETVAHIPSVLREIVEAHRPVRFDRSHFSAHTGSALRFETVYYVLDPDYNRFMDLQQAVYLGVLERLRREEIRVAGLARVRA
jgi:small-conductance mechanosensitive channel